MSEDLPVPIMEFDPVPFDEATSMFTDSEKYKYIRCLRFYWYHTHVGGILNDDEGLRELCHCPPDKWPRLKKMIFDGDKFFFLENEKWHQRRARKNYMAKQQILVKRQQQTAGARSVRWPVTESVTSQNGHISASVTAIQNEHALNRVERQIEKLRGRAPLSAKDLGELKEMKTERTRLMSALNLKA
jgi:uncharacterized protein YdaU (DUF1376 family)